MLKLFHFPLFLLKSWVRYVVSLCAFIGILILTGYLVKIEEYREKLTQQEYTQKLASQIRQKIEFQISHTMHLAQGLTLLSVDYPSTKTFFPKLAKEIINHAPFIRNIALAPNNVITQIYPLKGNEKALGLRYMDVPEQRDEIIRAIELKKSVIAGPINLVQGGKGIINRIPIFQGDSQETYWGIASLVVDLDIFLQRSGFLPLHEELRLVLLGRNDQIIFGDKSLFTEEGHISLPINAGSDIWFLGAILKNPASNNLLYWIKAIGLLLACIISSLIFFLLKSYETIHFQSLHDPLTSLPNIRFFYASLQHYILHAKREKSSFAILFIDIDKFKDINDTLGHKAGDYVLKEISKRLQLSLRESDTIARVGGDEFVILLKYANTDDEVAIVCKKLKDAIKTPIYIGKEVLHVRASIGHSFYPEHGQNATELMKLADNEMYKEKFARREKKEGYM